METTTVAANGLEFTVRLGGGDRGPVVLLLHGFPTDGSCFDEVVSRLHESDLRTVVPDQRGYSAGARPDDPQAYLLENIRADAIAILDALDIGYAIVAGHDFGGLVAWQLAGFHPDRITGLVAVSTGHPSAAASALADADQREKSSYIKDFLKPGAEDALLADEAALLRSLVPDDSVAPLTDRAALTAALGWYRANFTGDIAAHLACPPVDVPTTMLWSADDPYLGRAQAERSGRFVRSDFRFSVLDGVDHWIPQRAPAAVASEISLRSAVF
ncbi:alpha/beta hydrolase [Gordonia jinhuaensis]|uniref:Epoxide hydrolase n=1 Tax=Gordonia jinhuaensis TaxID=1517702 RepID=A0A916WT12_9ACTN|nr:alpha/beta hydrolase [Gordonia jinhuaensis]GGB26902.1 epoxide hydrolase [Gordonia jinhuaensis]